MVITAMPRRGRRLIVAVCALFVLVSIVGWLGIARLGHWLVVSDPLSEADAIVVT
jgi:hypothetical protein